MLSLITSALKYLMKCSKHKEVLNEYLFNTIGLKSYYFKTLYIILSS